MTSVASETPAVSHRPAGTGRASPSSEGRADGGFAALMDHETRLEPKSGRPSQPRGSTTPEKAASPAGAREQPSEAAADSNTSAPQGANEANAEVLVAAVITAPSETARSEPAAPNVPATLAMQPLTDPVSDAAIAAAAVPSPQKTEMPVQSDPDAPPVAPALTAPHLPKPAAANASLLARGGTSEPSIRAATVGDAENGPEAMLDASEPAPQSTAGKPALAESKVEPAAPPPREPAQAAAERPGAAPVRPNPPTATTMPEADSSAKPMADPALQPSGPAHVHTASPQGAAPQAVPLSAAQPVPVNALAIEIATQARAGNSRFDIRLDPPELGRIDVRLDVDREGNVTSRLVIERAETYDLLRRDQSTLERALQHAGLKTSDNALEFSLRDQNLPQRRDTDDLPNTARALIHETETQTGEVANGYAGLFGVRGGIDIRV